MSAAPWLAPRSRRSAWWASPELELGDPVPQRGHEARLSASSVSADRPESAVPELGRGRRGTAATVAVTGCCPVRRMTVAIQGILASTTDNPGPGTGLWFRDVDKYFELFLEPSMLWSRQLARLAGELALARPPAAEASGRRLLNHRHAGPGSRPRPRAVPLPVAAPFDHRPPTACARVVSTLARWRSLLDHRRAPLQCSAIETAGNHGSSRPHADGWNPRSRRLLPTTNTELSAIAAPAIIGDSSPAAARGSAATL